jgi:hypothetical protein
MKSKGPHNNGMHPTADTLPVKFIEGAARRVMPSVRFLSVNCRDILKGDLVMNRHQVYAVVVCFLALVVSAKVANAQSTDLDHPTPITSNIVSGSLERGEKGRIYYYSVVAGPGEVNFTLSIGKSDGGVFQAGLTVLDENEVVLASFSATSGTYGGGQENKIVTLKRRQRIILQFGHTAFSGGGGDFRLRIGGAVEFGQNKSDGGITGDTPTSSQSPTDNTKCFPKKGTLIVKMKDGSKKIIDLSEAESVTVVP